MLSEPLLDDKAPSATSCLSARGVLFTIVSAVALVGAGCFSLANTLLSGGFSGGGGGGGACGDRESCLGIVDDFLLHQPRQSYFSRPHVGLIQTFGPDSVGGGPCGDEMCKLVEPCPNYAQTPHCRYDVYDNALAAIYLTKRGQIEEARKILDAFIELLYPPHPCAPQILSRAHLPRTPDPFSVRSRVFRIPDISIARRTACPPDGALRSSRRDSPMRQHAPASMVALASPTAHSIPATTRG